MKFCVSAQWPPFVVFKARHLDASRLINKLHGQMSRCAVDGKARALYSQFSRAPRTGVALSHFASCRLLNLQVALSVPAGVAHDTVNSLRTTLRPLFSPHKPLHTYASHHSTRRCSCHPNIPLLCSFVPCSPARVASAGIFLFAQAPPLRTPAPPPQSPVFCGAAFPSRGHGTVRRAIFYNFCTRNRF